MSYYSVSGSDLPGVPSDTPGSIKDNLKWARAVTPSGVPVTACFNDSRKAWVDDKYCAFKAGTKPEQKLSIGEKLMRGLDIAGKMQPGTTQQAAAPSSIPWTPILAVGAGVVVLAVLLKKKG